MNSKFLKWIASWLPFALVMSAAAVALYVAVSSPVIYARDGKPSREVVASLISPPTITPTMRIYGPLTITEAVAAGEAVIIHGTPRPYYTPTATPTPVLSPDYFRHIFPIGSEAERLTNAALARVLREGVRGQDAGTLADAFLGMLNQLFPASKRLLAGTQTDDDMILLFACRDIALELELQVGGIQYSYWLGGFRSVCTGMVVDVELYDHVKLETFRQLVNITLGFQDLTRQFQ